MTYPEVLAYLESFINYERVNKFSYKESFKLERMTAFLDKVGNPQETLRCLHVAGSKGKGSVCAFMTYILRQAGFRVGLYTSPHLVDFRERIRILLPDEKQKKDSLIADDFEGMVSREEVVWATEALKDKIEDFCQESAWGRLSFFEVYTAVAFEIFSSQQVDFVVLETGLGGRLDATNVVNPLLCAITSISYEHTQKLGKTLKEIACEKAGIIKPPQDTYNKKPLVVICGPQEREALEVIEERCRLMQAQLILVGRDVSFFSAPQGLTIKTRNRCYQALDIPLVGRHQQINAAMAVAAMDELRRDYACIDEEAIRLGLRRTRWPGRCERISSSPQIILDGAQNLASCQCLKETIKEYFPYRRLILVLGVSRDKDKAGICRCLEELADFVILTRADNPRATPPEELARHFSSCAQIILTASVEEAMRQALSKADKDDLILVTGSLFVVGQARRYYYERVCN